MCGIVGIIDRVGEYPPSRYLSVLQDAMWARGPDGEGTFIEGPVALGMRRLAIIDPAHGHQPLTSREGQVVVFQNGEIYNYRELRRDLVKQGHVFRTESDTEVIAHGYAEWGMTELLTRIDGMYALVVLDRDNGELHLVRDRFGEKPLFYAHCPGRFAYASDLRLLAALPWVGDAPDPISLDHYLAVHYIAGDRTVFQGIRRVLPGERLQIPLESLSPKRIRYWRPNSALAKAETGEGLVYRLEQAVRSRMVADVPVGVFLSGGLDSSLLAAISAQLSPRIATFSMGFRTPRHDESLFAQAVAEAVGSTHHHFQFDEDDFLALIPQVAAALDEPLGDQATLPLFVLSQEARRHVKVVLSGEGADELFGGYGYYATSTEFLSRLCARLNPRERRFVRNTRPITPSGFPLLADAAQRASCFIVPPDPAPDDWEIDFLGWLGGIHDSLERAQAADLATWLPDDLLVKLDRMAMANSLEGRVPYLTADLAISALALPKTEKMGPNGCKLALRQIAERWLPYTILSRPKQGFILPMAEWLSQWFDVHGGAREYYAASDVSDLGLKADRLAALTEMDLARGIRNERLLFALVMLAEWRRYAREQISVLRSRIFALCREGQHV